MNTATPPLATATPGDALAADAVLMSVGGTLAFIVLLMVALAWVFRRSGLQRRLHDAQGMMTLVASKSLGARERVVLMDVGDQRLVLGVTATQITCLSAQARPDTDLPAVSTPPPSFAAMLAKVRQRHRQDPTQ